MKFDIPDAKAFLSFLKTCKEACSQNDSRPATKMMELCVQDDILTVTTLDGYIMLQKKMRVQDAEDGNCVVAPEDLLQALAGALGFAHIELDGETLTCKTSTRLSAFNTYTEQPFIRHEGLWPQTDNPFSVYVDPGKLLQLLRGMKTKKTLKLQFNTKNNLTPIVLSAGDETRALLLPVRSQS